MRSLSLVFCFILGWFSLQANVSNGVSIPQLSINNPLKIEVIDALDSVYFDFSKIIKKDSFIEIPVFIETDDNIFTLDFSLKFDVTKLSFVDVIDHTEYIQYASFYNPADSVLRFTSNSLSKFKLNNKIVSLKFKVLKNSTTTKDLSNILVYLNGDQCSVKLPFFQFMLVNNEEIEDINFATVYPNPASELLVVQSAENAMVELMDISGKNCHYRTHTEANRNLEIPLDTFHKGVYILKIHNGKKSTTRKIVIQ